jgi:metal-sulfur cluster biosynthetic enzyme
MASCASKETIAGRYNEPPSSYRYKALGFLHSKAMIDQDDVLEALSNVIDPELGLDFVELGLVYGVEIDGGTVNITFTLTTPACPIGPQVSEQMEEFVGELPGVTEVVPNMVFSPPWTPDKMSEDAKFALGY